MSEPIRIHCNGPDNLPSLEHLISLTTAQNHVVLQFPSTPEMESGKAKLIETLAKQLPGHRVFNSGVQQAKNPSGTIARLWKHKGNTTGTSGTSGTTGTTWITIKLVISESEVLANAEQIISAARLFRQTAHELMNHLARKLGVPLEAFADPLFRMTDVPGAPQPEGELENGWTFWFHGFECAFENRQTGQEVEVRLGFLHEFGALDPYFFARFVSTTPELQQVQQLFEDTYHDPARAFDVLEKHGYLKRIKGKDEFGLLGLVVSDVGDG
ncbi:MAG: hypothetical protein V4671_18430 [Armatimonadota bacterium]